MSKNVLRDVEDLIQNMKTQKSEIGAKKQKLAPLPDID
jgi:hypothetical protein